MKKNYFLLFAFLIFLSIGNLNAQVGLYSFSANPGTFTPIAGGIDVNSVEADDAISANLNIGFTFNMDGSDFTRFKMSSNGYITFNLSAGASQPTNNLDFVAAGSRPLAAPMWDDLAGNANSKASYLLSGTAPNRVLTVEWLNWKWRYDSPDSVISFQVKLYETSNKIEYVYQQGPNAQNLPSASIGLSGVGSGNNSYISLENTSIFPSVRSTGGEISNLNSKPANGQVYAFEPPTCSAPSNLVSSAVGVTNATISWTAAAQSWYYSIEYGPAGFAPGTGTLDSAKGTSVTLTGLTGSTNYEAYVRNICNLFDSSLQAGPISFRTGCPPFIAPYTMDFEASGTGVPACWNSFGGDIWRFANNYGGNHIGNVARGTSNAPTGGNPGFSKSKGYFAWVDDSNPNGFGTTLETPFVDISALTVPRLTFFLLSDDESTTLSRNINFHVDVWDGATWNDSIFFSDTNTTNGQWEQIIIDLTALTVTGPIKARFVVDEVGTGFYDDRAIDDIVFEETPTCFDPSNLMSSNVSGDTADISWTDPNSTTPGSWQVSYGLAGFTPGSGTQTLFTSNSGTLRGLMGSTGYDWYVRAICGSGDTSAWSSSSSFVTLCGTDTIPYLQDFNVFPPLCWDMNAPGGSGVTNLWKVQAPGMIQADFWGVVSGTQIIQSGNIYVNANSWLKFDWSSNSYVDTDSIAVQARANGGTWITIWGQNASTGLNSNSGAGNSNTPGTLITETIILDPATFTNKSIEVRIVAISGYGADVYFDNLIVEQVPSCLPPSALNNILFPTMVRTKWTDNNTPTPGSWQVSYGAPGFTAGSGTQVISTADSLDLTTLSSNTAYEWYVRAICSATDTGGWSPVGSFTTPCLPVVAPYTMDFETSGASIPNCWSQSGTGGDTWRFANTYGFNHIGNVARGSSNSPTAGNPGFSDSKGYFAWIDDSQAPAATSRALETPFVDVSALTVPRLTFFILSDDESSTISRNSSLHVDVWDGAAWNDSIFLSDSNSIGGQWEKIIIDLSTLTITGPIKARFVVDEDPSNFYDDKAIDDIVFEQTPNCVTPTSLSSSGITTTGATLAWTENTIPAATSWQISYGAPGFTPGSGTQVVAGTNPFALTGIMSSTNYDWYVRSLCSVGDTSAWSSSSSFTTLCPIDTIPYLQDFSAFPAPCWDFNAPGGSGVTNLWKVQAPGMIQADFWGVVSGTQIIQSGSIYVNADSRLKFDWSSNSYVDTDSIAVQVRANGGTWNTIWGENASSGLNSASGAGNSNNPGTLITETNVLDPVTYTNKTIEVRVVAISGYGADFFFDNLVVEKIPTCIDGSGILGTNPTTTSHDVYWTPGPLDVSWEVEYGTPGYTAGTGTTVAAATDSITVSGLISNTTYDVYFRGICSAGDTGSYIGPLSITTDAFPIVYDTTYPNTCYSYTTPLGGVTYTTSGLYFDTVKGATPHVYDSAIHVYLATVNAPQYGLQVISICDSLVTGSGTSLLTSGIYVDSLTSKDGCDSIMTIDLTITTTTYVNTMATECDSVMWRGNMYYATGILIDTVSTGSCDSIFIHNLTVNYATYATTTSFVCDSFVSPSGKVWKTTGMYMDTIPNASGCDSVMSYNLTFGYISYASTTDTVCDMYMSPSGKVWTTSGTYLDTIVNASGCDSAMTFNLTINYNKAVTVSVTVCDSYTRPGGTTVNYSGTFIDVIPTTKGCDSTITTLLTVNYTTYSTTNITSCDTWTSPSGKVIRYSGTVYDTITNTMGCDSLMVVNLTIKASTSETRTVDACFTYTQPETGNVYSTSGTYTDVVTNAAGCNHTITTVLTINTANAGTLSVSGITLTCSAVGVTYKWVDCDNDYSYILGATSQSYTPIRNGNYACWVTTPEGCTDTTGMCMSINSVSLEEFEITESDINIYPNPATDFVTVDILSQNIEEDVTIKMFDAIGKLVYSQEVSSTNNKVTFDVSQFENGVYTVTVSNEFFLTTKKVVVSK